MRLLGGSQVAGRAGQTGQPASRSVALEDSFAHGFSKGLVDFAQVSGDLSAIFCLDRLSGFLNEGPDPGFNLLVCRPSF